jgi:hypothetical protein
LAGTVSDVGSQFFDPIKFWFRHLFRPVPRHRVSRGRARQKNDRTGKLSIRKTERPRSANLLQMPRGLMCKLRQRGRDCGGPAGSRGIVASLQPLPLRSNCWGRPLWTGGIRTMWSLNRNSWSRLSGFQHWCCAVRWPVLHLRVAYFGQHPRFARAMRARGRDISARMGFVTDANIVPPCNRDRLLETRHEQYRLDMQIRTGVPQ